MFSTGDVVRVERLLLLDAQNVERGGVQPMKKSGAQPTKKASVDPMKIVVLGAGQLVGLAIVKEAVARNHFVTGVVRVLERVPGMRNLREETCLFNNFDKAVAVLSGHDVIVSALCPERENTQELKAMTQMVIDAARKVGIKRVIVIGDSTTLEISPGVMRMHDTYFREWDLPGAYTHLDVLERVRKATDLDWTFFSLPITVQLGERTGKFRVGGDALLTDSVGRSQISAADFAIPVMDEVEHPKAIHKRLTAAY